MALKKDSKDKVSTSEKTKASASASSRKVTESSVATAASDDAIAAPAETVNVDDFARLIASMSRLLVGFGELKQFQESGLGLGEWVALSMAARQEGLTTRLMSRNLGVPVQRVTQISASLAQKGLVEARQGADGGKPSIKVTDAGKAKLEVINAELESVLGKVLKPRSLGSALGKMRPLGRVLRTGRPEKAGKKQERKAKESQGAPEGQAAAAQA